MLYDLHLAWRNIRSRPVQTLIASLVIAAAIALAVAVTLLSDGLREGIKQASDPFGVLVVGAKGSGQQLVLSTLLLRGAPVGNIDYHIYEELSEDERVTLAVPLAMGDNVGGARIIGTNDNFFELRRDLRQPPVFQLAQGELFDEDYEAILGSRAAASLGLQIGDRFFPQHGVEPGLAGDEHDIPHTIVGTLEPTNSAYDNAILTTLGSVWAVHEEGPSLLSGPELDLPAADEEGEEHGGEEHGDEEHGGEEHGDEEHGGEEHVDAGQITAVLVQPVGFVESNLLWQEFYTGTEAQAAFPGGELGELFDLLSQGQQLLNITGWLAGGMAALTLLLAIYSATLAREQAIAIMRSLGASRASVFRIVLFEALLVALLGLVLGRVLGQAAALAVAGSITGQSAVPVPVSWLVQWEVWLWLLLPALALAAGALPAALAYRVHPVEKLFST